MFNKKRVLPLALAVMLGITSVPSVPVNVMAQPNTENQILATNSNASENPNSTKPHVDNASAYHYVWSDEFNGSSLDRTIWNVETHEPGWVNNELQEYVDSDDNIKVQDGTLVIQPKKDGDKYTSGRINTQGKKDMKYGAFEVRAKVPSGKGYLPAFWMMPTNENLYGQWPRCGEIDCMEVMGHETNKVYGTIHYGNPHSQKQNTYTLSNGNFADEFHTYTCEWEPGKITWYIDGIKYHEANDWYSTTVGQGTVAYPAPFDQPFYVILNLAIGGSWVGYPDENTTYDDQSFVVDYVRAYQKDNYDENVQKPEKEIVLKEADVNGNYITNGDFSVAESLSDDDAWKFMTAQGGEATASISDNTMKINTIDAGSVDYSVQLVQTGLPFEKGATYEISFDAKADEERATNVAVKAPDLNYATYWSEDINLTTEYRNYSFTYKMTESTDANSRLEYNMGAKESTASIYIKNVSIKKTQDADPNEVEQKTVRADGNYIYNGAFQEGANRMEYWTIAGDIDASVTPLSDSRRLKVDVSSTDSTVAQTDLPVSAGSKYALSFDAEGIDDSNLTVSVAGVDTTFALSSDKKSYNAKITLPDEISNNDIVITFDKAGVFYLDNIRLVEDTLIKNGSFNAGLSGYEMYIHDSASASYVVDSISEDNALDVTIKNTSDAEWKVQLKQSTVELEKDKYYKLSFDAKSSIDRTIQYAIQRNGAVHKDANGSEDWTPYTQSTVSLDAYGESGEYTHITNYFQMKEDTDTASIFNIALGGGNNKTQHRVCIDNIVLEEINEAEMPKEEIESQPTNTNLLKNSDFSEDMNCWTETIANWEGGPGATATHTTAIDSIVYNITNVGTEDWNVQLKQSGVILENGETYKVTFDATSSEDRYIKSGIMSTTYSWYGGSDIILKANEINHVSYTFKMNTTDNAADFYISMGKILDPANVETPASVITLSNISLIKVGAHTHNFTAVEATDATCTETGNIKYYTCDCGKFFSAENENSEIEENSWGIESLGHEYKSVLVKASTKQDGYTADKCIRCDDITNKNVIKAIKGATLAYTNITYNCVANKPAVTVKDTAGNVISADNYSVTYSDNKNIGTATVTIKFKGNYTGTIVKHFDIVPLETIALYAKSQGSGFKLYWLIQPINTTGYEIAYTRDKNFKTGITTTTVKKSTSVSTTINKLSKNTKYYVRIRTYKTVNGKNYYSPYTNTVCVTTK